MNTVPGVLADAAAQLRDKTFLDFAGEPYSYRQVFDDAKALAAGLQQLGLQRGETVATVLDNNYDALRVWFGINFAGGVSVPVNTAYKGEFLHHQIADSGARFLVAETDYCERIVDIEDGLGEAQRLFFRGSAPAKRPARLTLGNLDDLHLKANDYSEINIAPSDLAMLIYTAGTTGPSKGCMISHNYAFNLARQAAASRVPDDILWTPLPLFHFNATCAATLGTAVAGNTIVLFSRFSLSKFWPEIERTKATIAGLLGSMIPLIAQAADTPESKRCYGQLRAVGGAPFPAELQEIWRNRFGVQRCGSNAYGLTEACLMTSLPDGLTPAPGSSGRTNEDFDVRIVDDDDNEVPPGTPGEIICRPKKAHVMFEGYWRRPEATQSVMRNMWLHTGDIGKFDKDGFFYFVDRKKDYLRRRGENISSVEVETAFRAHEAIEDVAAHAVKSDLGEDDLKVTAILKAGAALTEEALCLWAIDRMPYFAVPRYIEFRAELPRNPVGRVLKYQLRDEGCTPGTWDRQKSSVQFTKR
ncbi:MAG: AMP-binding protein [Caulobacteraceae bacterium]